MEQKKIWNYFQTTQPESFSGAGTRLMHLSNLLKNGSSVMNIGVGSGQFERLSERKASRLVSLDPDPGSLSSAQLPEKSERISGLIQQMPFPDASFDYVVASEVLEHLDNETLARGLSEIKRVLKKGGHFLGSVPHAEDLSSSIVVCPDCGKVFHKVGHVQSFSRTRLSDILRSQFPSVSTSLHAFMNTRSLAWHRLLIAAIRSRLVAAGLLTRDMTIVFQATKA